MRILLWHGYLLGGTGSNVYTRQLAREWRRAGHDVTVLSQDPRPDEYDLGGATTVRPDVGGLLPVFVLDRYEGYEVRLVQDCTRAELDAWVEANAAAVRRSCPPTSCSRTTCCSEARSGRPPARRSPSRRTGPSSSTRCAGARSCRRGERRRSHGARATFVGSGHIRQVLEDVCGHVERVHEVPPGVDVDLWQPEARERRPRPPARGGRARPAEPGEPRGAAPRRGQRRATRRVPRRRPARRSSTSAS